MSSFIDRLSIFMRYKGINDNQMTVAAGLSVGLLGKAKSGNKGMSSNNIEKILLAYPDLSPDWLLTGSGEMLKNDTDTLYASTTDSPAGIPLIPAKAMAGFLTGEVTINEADCERIDIPGVKADFAIPVSGDSMTPLYLSGDMVICQFVNLSDMFFQWGKVYVINTNQGVLIKKVRPGISGSSIKLISENPDYDPIDLPLSDIYQIALVKGLVRLT